MVAYVLLVGYPPFMEKEQTTLFKRIRNGDWKFDEKDWEPISQEAKDFIRGLLVTNPKERMTTEQCLASPWINQSVRRLSSVDLSESLRQIKLQKNRLRSVARAIMWVGGGGGGARGKRASSNKSSLSSVSSRQSSPPPTVEVPTQAQEIV